jgi:hypothetical protein
LPGSLRWILHLDVLVGVMLTGFFGVVDRMDVMPLRNVRMVPSLLMIPSFMVVGCRSMMTSGVIMVFRGFAMMLSGFFGPGKPPMQYRNLCSRVDYRTVNVGLERCLIPASHQVLPDRPDRPGSDQQRECTPGSERAGGHIAEIVGLRCGKWKQREDCQANENDDDRQ